MAGARIVLTTFGSLGDLHPYVAVALGLKERGHRPVIATLPSYREKIEQAGLEHAPVRPDLADLSGDMNAWMRRIMDQNAGTETVIRDIAMQFLNESYVDLDVVSTDADLIISHMLAYSAPLIAERRQKKWLSVALQPMIFLSAFDPPVYPQFPALENLRNWGPWFWRAFRTMGLAKIRGWFRPIDSLRRELGLATTKAHPGWDGGFSPDGTLALFSRSLAAPSPDWPARTTVTGFPFYDRLDHHTGIDPDLKNFMANGSAPLVFTLGSSAVNDAGNFFRNAVDASVSLRQRAVLLIGKDERNQFHESLPDNIFAAQYAPFSELFPKARAIIHQAGVGTTGQAMRAGKPCLIVPYAHDQPDNAARLARLGMARVLPRSQLTRQRLAAELDQLLSHHSYTDCASLVGSEVRAEKGVETACDAIEAAL